MTKTAVAVGGAVLGAAAVGAVVGVVGPAFTVAGPRAGASSGTATQQFLSARPEAAAQAHAGPTLGAGVALAASGLVAASAVRRSRRAGAGAASAPAVVPVGLGCSVSAPAEQYFRDQLVACRAQLSEAGAPSVEETDQHMQELQAHAKQVLAGAAAALVFSSSMEAAVAYPIYAQQNYANPRALNGKIACANCHLAGKEIDVRMPHDVLADTIFKAQIDVPCKYEKRRQLIADGSKAALNIGAIAIMPEGWKLAPKAPHTPKPQKHRCYVTVACRLGTCSMACRQCSCRAHTSPAGRPQASNKLHVVPLQLCLLLQFAFAGPGPPAEGAEEADEGSLMVAVQQGVSQHCRCRASPGLHLREDGSSHPGSRPKHPEGRKLRQADHVLWWQPWPWPGVLISVCLCRVSCLYMRPAASGQLA